MSLKKSKYHRKGFTLLELLIVVTIIALLSLFTYNSLSKSTRQLTFINSFEKIGDLFREVRNLALAGEAVPDYTDYDGDGYSFDGDYIDRILQDTPGPCNRVEDPNNPNTCDKDERIIAAGTGLHIIPYDKNNPETSNKIIVFTDLRNESEGEFIDPGNSPTVEEYKTDKDIIKRVIDYNDTDFTIYLMPEQPSIDLIYSPPFAELTVNGEVGVDNLSNYISISLLEGNELQTTGKISGNNYGKVYVINTVSGVPEAIEIQQQ